MTDQEQKRCHRLAKKYSWSIWLKKRAWHTEQDQEAWNHVCAKIRNAMFEIIKEDMLKYVLQNLKEWKKYEVREEVLFLAWHAFLFSLTKYRNFERPLSFHFFSYTRYFLLGHYGRKDQVFLPLDDLDNILSVEPTELNQLFIKLMRVQEYRQELNPKYFPIFDQAFQSLHDAPKLRNGKWNKEIGVPQKVYDNLKTVFKDTILFLIK